MSALPGTPPPIRSTFVTVLAWIFIGLAGFATLISVLQNLMLQMLFLPALHQSMTMRPLPSGAPAPMTWMFGHFVWIFRGVLLLTLTTLIAAIGLLHRKNWARRLFIGLMVFAIVYQLLDLVFQWRFMGSMPHLMQAPGAPVGFDETMVNFMQVMRIFGAIMAAGFCILSGWIIKRLCSAAVRLEFSHPQIAP